MTAAAGRRQPSAVPPCGPSAGGARNGTPAASGIATGPVPADPWASAAVIITYALDVTGIAVLIPIRRDIT